MPARSLPTVTACTAALLVAGFFECAIALRAQTWHGTKVKLAASTFTPEQLRELQPIADRVADIVDELIPGEPQDYPAEGIVCFEAPARWKTPDYARDWSPPPVTISGPRAADEPSEVQENTLRIALNEDPWPNELSLVYQLSHELAHVKIGHRTDNYLDETFAVAVSLEVLRRLGYFGFLLQAEGLYLRDLPAPVQLMLADGQWKEAQKFWVATSKAEGAKPPAEQLADRPFQTLGALLLLHTRSLRWSDLLGISNMNVCAASVPASGFKVCPPDLSQMQARPSLLKPLGLLSHR